MFRLAALYVVERLREQLLAHIADMLKAACVAKVCFACGPSQPVLVPCEGCQNMTFDVAEMYLPNQAAGLRRQARVDLKLQRVSALA